MATTTESADSAAIEAHDLRMRYGDTDVVRGIDLDVHRGEVLALLGPNAAGKTTTIEILEGFRQRSGGQVRVLGTDPDTAGRRWRERIGIVLQSWRDHARWRVGELLTHIAAHYPNPRDPEQVLHLVGLNNHAGQRAERLSGGQRRRLDVALGIIGRPELLFLDEPTAGFDPQARRDFHELIERLAGTEETTVLLTTHDLVEAERLADRIAILVAGELAGCGTPAELATVVRAEAQVRWSADGVPRRELTPDPSQFVWELHRAFDGPVPDLEVRRPSLEDTYLHLVHHGNGVAEVAGQQQAREVST